MLNSLGPDQAGSKMFSKVSAGGSGILVRVAEFLSLKSTVVKYTA